ncbi:C4-dicarboxylate ABC transporter [Fischerella thermalis CCMEE 5273]|nr:C4-dicarboxylate ABC transporter [Fischerella thermalis CCMEE 5273]
MFGKKKSLMVLLIAFSLLLVACGNGEDASGAEYNWRLAHEESPDGVQDVYANEFAKRLKEKSDGRINLEIFTFGQIGNPADQVEMLQAGEIDFAIMSPGFTGTIVPEANIFALHFLFTDDIKLNQEILNTSEALNGMLTDKYKENDLYPLSYWTEGAMMWTSNKPLNSVEDFKGFRMRTQDSPLITASYEAYGAAPTPMDWGELYTGLQQGQVDGQENPVFFIDDEGFYEVQDYLTLSKHNMYITTTSTNPEFFEGLPEDIQEIVLETIEEMKAEVYGIQDELNEKGLQNIQETDTEIVELTEEEREAFREAAMPVRDFYVENYGGAEILELLEQEIEEAQQ